MVSTSQFRVRPSFVKCSSGNIVSGIALYKIEICRILLWFIEIIINIFSSKRPHNMLVFNPSTFALHMSHFHCKYKQLIMYLRKFTQNIFTCKSDHHGKVLNRPSARCRPLVFSCRSISARCTAGFPNWTSSPCPWSHRAVWQLKMAMREQSAAFSEQLTYMLYSIV